MRFLLGMAVGVFVSFMFTPLLRPVYETTLLPVYQGGYAILQAVIAGD